MRCVRIFFTRFLEKTPQFSDKNSYLLKHFFVKSSFSIKMNVNNTNFFDIELPQRAKNQKKNPFRKKTNWSLHQKIDCILNGTVGPDSWRTRQDLSIHCTIFRFFSILLTNYLLLLETLPEENWIWKKKLYKELYFKRVV